MAVHGPVEVEYECVDSVRGIAYKTKVPEDKVQDVGQVEAAQNGYNRCGKG